MTESPLEIYSPVVKAKKGEYKNLLLKLHQQGYMRARIDGTLYWLEETVELDKKRRHTIECLIDRMKVREDNRSRLSEAVEMALKLSDGFVLLVSEGMPDNGADGEVRLSRLRDKFAGHRAAAFLVQRSRGSLPRLRRPRLPHALLAGARREPPSFRSAEGGFIPWKSMKHMIQKAEKLAEKKGWDISRPFGGAAERGAGGDALRLRRSSAARLPPTAAATGNTTASIWGLIPWIEKRYNETESENYKEELDRYPASRTSARPAKARDSSPRRSPSTLGGYNIRAAHGDARRRAYKGARTALSSARASRKSSASPLIEVRKRPRPSSTTSARGYLSLSRRADTLSGGESQRIRLASQIGSQLTGVLYVLDEPTIGLHPRDTNRLLDTLRAIRDIGNTVLVVEHDRDTMARRGPIF